MSVERSRTGHILTSNAVDWSQPVQYQPQQFRSFSKGGTEQGANWRQFTFARDILSSYDITSFKVSAYSVDLYGKPLEFWITIMVDGGSNDGQILYNRGWSTESINQASFTSLPAVGQKIRCYMRFRYVDGEGTNPPATADIAEARVTIDFLEAVNYSEPQTTAIPSDWTVNTTVTATGFPDYPTMTSTYSTDSISGDISTYNPFGIDKVLSTWTSFCSVLVSLHTALPWLSLLIGFCCLCSIIWWLLR